jgi:hypothetical protein
MPRLVRLLTAFTCLLKLSCTISLRACGSFGDQLRVILGKAPGESALELGRILEHHLVGLVERKTRRVVASAVGIVEGRLVTAQLLKCAQKATSTISV